MSNVNSNTGATYNIPRSPPQFQHIWEEAISGLKASVDSAAYLKITAINSIDNLLAEVNTLNDKYKKRIVSRLLKRLDPFFLELGRFTTVVNIFVQSNTAISSLVWGSIYFVLDVAARHRDYLKNVVSMFELIERHMPRIRTYAELFTNANRIEKAVCGLYHELTRFCLNAIRHLKRNPLINIFSLALPKKSYQMDFDRTLNNIRDYSYWIDVEAFVAFHEASMDINTRRYEEIMKSLPVHTLSASAPLPLSIPKNNPRIIPRLKNPNFYGRVKELSVLSDVFHDAISDRLLIFSIIGMGGVGKSQLALHYLYTHLERLDAVFWISADSEAKVAQGYAMIAKEAGLLDEGSQPSSLEAICELVKQWFKDTSLKWLLVLDNVESLSSINSYWPNGAHGRIIITSRNMTASQAPTTASIVLDPFTPEDGARLLLSLLPEGAQQEHHAIENATRISATCGGLALALSQGARFISTVHIPIAELSRLCATTAAFVYPQSTLNSAPNDYYYPGTVSTAWDQTLNVLRPCASFLARLSVFFDPDNISETLLRLGTEHAGLVSEHTHNGGEYYQSIAMLFSHLLISKSNTSGVYLMHPLVQAVIGNRMTVGEMSFTFTIALTLIDDCFPRHEPFVAQWETCILNLPHVTRLGMLYQEAKVNLSLPDLLKLGQLLERGSWYLQERGQLDQATGLLSDAERIAKHGTILMSQGALLDDADMIEDKLKELHSDVLNQQGSIEYGYCRFQKSLDLYLQSLEIKRSMHVPDANEICYLIRNAGSAYMKLDQLSKAFELFQESLSLRQRQLTSVTNPEAYKYELANNYGSISTCLYRMGEFEQALKTANYSTELCKQVYAGDNFIMARCYNNIGNIKRDQGLLDAAEKLYLKALDIRTTQLGDHCDTALSLHKYATVLYAKGKQTESLECTQYAVNMLRKFPKHQIALARSLLLLSIVQGAALGQENGKVRTEALRLYGDHVGKNEVEVRDGDVTMEELDSLVLD